MTKILLVEDDKSLREIYGVRLLAEGYDIVSAGDGEEALAMAIKERPQLIVSDVMMPKISGFDMLDILRSTTETKNIKVIMMTALSSEDQRQRGVALGADRYLVKSQVGIEDVVRTVHEVLEDKSSPTPSATTVTPADAASVANVAPEALPPALATTPEATPSAPTPAAPQVAAMPQPTAPFSTPRPANLGDRVIQPLESNPNKQKDFSTMMDAELTKAATETMGSSPSVPVPMPPTPPSPTNVPEMTPPTMSMPGPAPLQPMASSIPTTSIPITDGTPDPLADSEPLAAQQAATATAAPAPTAPDAQPVMPTPPQQTMPAIDDPASITPVISDGASTSDAPATTSTDGIDTTTPTSPSLPNDFVAPEFEETNPSRPPQQ